MLSENTKKRLQETWPQKNTSVARLIYQLYRYFSTLQVDRRQSENKPIHYLKPGYVYLLANIGLGGSTNKDLAKKAMVTKQAMSKLINEMICEKIVEIEKDSNDGRSNKIILTNTGAELLIDIWGTNQLLIDEFETHIGKPKTKLLLELMSELVDSLMPTENKNDKK